MATEFKAEVFQNPYLPRGTGEVHAIMTVSAGNVEGGGTSSARLFGIICDASGSMDGGKMIAARDAISKLINLLPDDVMFFIVCGNDSSQLVFPVARATQENKFQALAAIRKVRADGGTHISTWLSTALEQFKRMPEGVRRALLLTDGQNDDLDNFRLEQTLAGCEGVFQCDCRGVGTDWKVDQLKK